MKASTSLNYILLGIIILGIVLLVGGTRETFVGASYPQSVTTGLLAGDYPAATHPGLSNASYSSAWRLYPTWADGSYAQRTNNVRYWKTPCNGWAVPATICGGLYGEKQFDKPPVQPPARCCERVNYYCST